VLPKRHPRVFVRKLICNTSKTVLVNGALQPIPSGRSWKTSAPSGLTCLYERAIINACSLNKSIVGVGWFWNHVSFVFQPTYSTTSIWVRRSTWKWWTNANANVKRRLYDLTWMATAKTKRIPVRNRKKTRFHRRGDDYRIADRRRIIVVIMLGRWTRLNVKRFWLYVSG